MQEPRAPMEDARRKRFLTLEGTQAPRAVPVKLLPVRCPAPPPATFLDSQRCPRDVARRRCESVGMKPSPTVPPVRRMDDAGSSPAGGTILRIHNGRR